MYPFYPQSIGLFSTVSFSFWLIFYLWFHFIRTLTIERQEQFWIHMGMNSMRDHKPRLQPEHCGIPEPVAKTKCPHHHHHHHHWGTKSSLFRSQVRVSVTSPTLNRDEQQNCPCSWVKFYAVKTCDEMEVYLHAFLTTALNACLWKKHFTDVLWT